MWEIKVDSTRCPGCEVCGDPICTKIFGSYFHIRVTGSGGLISEPNFYQKEEQITYAVIRCPAQAISVKKRQRRV